MKIIHSYSNFIDNKKDDIVLDTREKIQNWLDQHMTMKNNKNVTIHEDLSVSVIGDVDFSMSKFTKIPIKFRKVSKDFNVSYSFLLESLENCPDEVGEKFICDSCVKLTSLNGCPKIVGSFSCSGCRNLLNLNYSPVEIKNGGFACDNCEKIKTLEGSSQKIKSWFDCNNCGSLESLRGIAEHFDDYLSFSRCENIKSLQYLPLTRAYYCRRTPFEKILQKLIDKLGTSIVVHEFKHHNFSPFCQETLINAVLDKEIGWKIVEPFIDNQHIEKYRTATTLNKLGF